MNKIILIMVLMFSMIVFSCNQEIVLYDVVIQNNSSTTVSGTLSVTDEDDKTFSILSGGSETVGASAPYTVSYKNQYGKITGTIDYSSNKITFIDNPGLSLSLTNTTGKDVYIFTGGYIQGEILTAGEYKVDGTEGFKVNSSGITTGTIYTLVPSVVAKTVDNIGVVISWTINPPAMTGVVHY